MTYVERKRMKSFFKIHTKKPPQNQNLNLGLYSAVLLICSITTYLRPLPFYHISWDACTICVSLAMSSSSTFIQACIHLNLNLDLGADCTIGHYAEETKSAMIFHMELCQIVCRTSFVLDAGCLRWKQVQQGAFSVNIKYSDHSWSLLPLLGRSSSWQRVFAFLWCDNEWNKRAWLHSLDDVSTHQNKDQPHVS